MTLHYCAKSSAIPANAGHKLGHSRILCQYVRISFSQALLLCYPPGALRDLVLNISALLASSGQVISKDLLDTVSLFRTDSGRGQACLSCPDETRHLVWMRWMICAWNSPGNSSQLSCKSIQEHLVTNPGQDHISSSGSPAPTACLSKTVHSLIFITDTSLSA